MTGTNHVAIASRVRVNQGRVNFRSKRKGFKERKRSSAMDTCGGSEDQRGVFIRNGSRTFKFRGLESAISGVEEPGNCGCRVDDSSGEIGDDWVYWSRPASDRAGRGAGDFGATITGRPCGVGWFHPSAVFVTRGPYLDKRVRAAVWIDILARVHHLNCAKGEASPCYQDRSRCAERSGFYLGTDWSACPVRSIIDDARLQTVLSLERQAGMSSIADWPEGFASWVPDLWSKIRAARQDRMTHEAK